MTRLGAETPGGVQLHVLPEELPQHRHHLIDGVDRIDQPRAHHLLPAEGEQLAGKARGAFRGLLHLFDLEAAVDARQPIEREAAESQDGREQIVEVVRDAAGEAADRLHLLRFLQLPLDRFAGFPLLARLPPQLGVVALTFDRRRQPDQVVLEHVVVGARPHRLDRRVLADGARDDDECAVDAARLDRLQRVGRTEVGHRVIADDRVPLGVGDGGVERRRILHLMRFDPIARALELAHDQQYVVFRVLDEEDSKRAGCARRRSRHHVVDLAPAVAGRGYFAAIA